MAESYPLGSTMPLIWDELTLVEQQRLLDLAKLGELEEARRNERAHEHPGFRQQPNRQTRRAMARAERRNRA